MKIPYGVSAFAQIRDDAYFYADKTSFLPVLESLPPHLVFLRPRRFGKSTFASMLEHYYDLGRRERFDALFRGLWIHEHPTPERNSYLVLPLAFSRVATDQGEETLRRTFLQAVRGRVEVFLERYSTLVPSFARLIDRLDSFQDADALLGALLDIVTAVPHKLYVIIDEYDHFGNRLLSSGQVPLYEAIVKKTGFVRTFYATLKEGTATGAVRRMFITGVTPLMLDDLSSGFNMATHVSLSPRLNALAGFTRKDTERAVDEFLAARPDLDKLPEFGDRTTLLDVMEQHYNGYRFAEGARERVFNADMVLYFLDQIDDRRAYPANMLDQNVRTEYQHLRHIGALSGAGLAERRALLETIASDGHIRSDIVERFGVLSLGAKPNFLSLLYFLGMLTLSAEPRGAGGYDMEIPNRVIRELSWEHLAFTQREESKGLIQLQEIRDTLTGLAEQGIIEPFLDLFHKQVLKAFSNRDLRGLDEKAIKLLLMTYASLGHVYYPLSEKEFAQGYGDLFLAAARNIPSARYSWLLELKYLKAGARPARIEAAFAEAEGQVSRYAEDQALLPVLLGDRELRAGMLVFVGAKKVLYRAWPAAPAKPKVKVGRTAQAKRKRR
ncbi:MAG: AAA family ATPase [Byssovorax sp.]